MKKNNGFTITELMVGLALSLLLAFAVGTVYTQTRQTFSAQAAQTSLVEQGRYAVTLFQKMVAQAGYRSQTNTLLTKPISTAFTGGYVLKEAESVLEISFTGEDSGAIIQCNGSDYVDNAAIKNKISFVNNSLICTDGEDKEYILLNGNVVDFEIRYGEDTNGDKVPDSYNLGTSMADEDFKNVYAAKMCIILSNDPGNGAPLDVEQEYVACDGNTVTAEDKKLYRRFDTTVYMRNRFD